MSQHFRLIFLFVLLASLSGFSQNKEELQQKKDQLQKESQSFETLRPSSDLVGLEQAFNLATTNDESEEWSPSEED